MALTEEEIEQNIAKLGKIWHPDASRSSNIDTRDGFAFAFMNIMSPILTNVAKNKCPKLIPNIFLVDNNNFNAFAKTHPEKSEEFLIGIYRGVFDELMGFFYEDKVSNIALINLTILKQFDTPSVPRLCTHFAASYILFHEFTHVSRGHLGYAKAVRLDEDELIEIAPQKNGAEDRTRYLLECDADTRGGRYTAAELLNQIDKQISNHQQYNKKTLGEEMIFVAAFAIHSLFRIMESKRTTLPLNYPAHLVRSGIVNTQLVEGIHAMTPSSQPYVKDLEVKSAVTNGLLFANKACNAVALPSLTYDVEALATQFTQKDAAEVDGLTAKLQPYTPCP